MRSFPLVKRLRRFARDHAGFRPAVAALTNALVPLRGGGTLYQPPAMLLHNIVQAALGRAPQRTVDHYVQELLDDAAMAEAFAHARTVYPGLQATWPERVSRLIGHVTLYYAVVREVQPAVLVETGTARGAFTSLFLAAIHRNGKGRLISIDIPPVSGKLTMGITVDKSQIGALIPEAYKAAWEMHYGDAKLLLPRILAENDVDLFCHDSLHTPTHMAFEYAVARALTRERSIIMSDDITWNSSFEDFLVTNGLTGYCPFPSPDIGICVSTYSAAEKRAGIGIVRLEEATGTT